MIKERKDSTYMAKKKSGNVDVFHPTISVEENNRIFGGMIDEHDFSTNYPNKLRISKLSAGISEYLSYKNSLCR